MQRNIYLTHNAGLQAIAIETPEDESGKNTVMVIHAP